MKAQNWPTTVKIVGTSIFLIGLIGILSNCSPAKFAPSANNLTQSCANGSCVPVCPLPKPGTGNPKNGISADMAYFNPSEVSGHSSWPWQVANYFSLGHLVSASMFVNDLNYPTRPWTDGFVFPNGQPVKDNSGQTIYTYFALRMHTIIQLAANDPDGSYQFAVLSDDGMTMTSPANGTILNNDGVTPTRLRSSAQLISMTHSTQLPVEILWAQGPPVQIAIVLLWRKVNAAATSTGAPIDPQDGVSINTPGFGGWFNPGNGTTIQPSPLPPYNALVSRGWKPLVAANYWLPQGNNPCPQ